MTNLFVTASYQRKSPALQPVLRSDWIIAMEPWKHAKTYDTKTSEHVIVFYCPMRSRAHCRSEVRLTVTSEFVRLEQAYPHGEDSHRVETPHRLPVAVQDRIQSIVTADMKISSTQIRRSIARDGQDVAVSDKYRFDRALKKARTQVMKSASAIGSGFPNTDNIGDVRRFADQHSMKKLIARHNAADDDFHLGMHDMFTIGKEFSDDTVEFSIFFSNVWFLLTAFRVMIAGWGLNIFTDLFHRFCTARVRMICYGCCTLGYRMNPLMFGTIPHSHGESHDMYQNTFSVYLNALQVFVRNFKHCGNGACSTCKHIMSILAHATIRTYLASSDFTGEFANLPIRSFSSDNCSGFLKFVREQWPDGSVIALICSAHLNGECLPCYTSPFGYSILTCFCPGSHRLEEAAQDVRKLAHIPDSKKLHYNPRPVSQAQDYHADPRSHH